MEAHTKIARDIAHLIGKHKVDTSLETRLCYRFDATTLKCLPQIVTFPESCDDVKAIISVCHSNNIAFLARGAGTGFVGGTVPCDIGVVISTERMNRIISIDAERKIAVVQPGVVNQVLQNEASKHGLMFPPDPSSLEVCTLGGNVAQDAGGPKAVKYGVTRDYVLGIEVILQDARIVKSHTHKASGWDPVTSLLVGSEGTLGVFTEITLRLVSKPETTLTALACLRSMEVGAEVVNSIFASGVLPAAVEIIDSTTLACITDYVEFEVPPGTGSVLIVETDGRREQCMEEMQIVEQAMKSPGILSLHVATSEAQREELWKMRRAVSPSLARIAPNKINEDICVPRSKLPQTVSSIANLAKKYSLTVPTFGHAGDGNLHVNVMIDKRDASQVKRAEAFVTELFDVTLALGGTISGEHGIGITKRDFLIKQLGSAGMELEHKIKAAFDPDNLVNPGKVIRLS